MTGRIESSGGGPLRRGGTGRAAKVNAPFESFAYGPEPLGR